MRIVERQTDGWMVGCLDLDQLNYGDNFEDYFVALIVVYHKLILSR